MQNALRQAAFVARDVQAFLDNPAAAKADLLHWLTLLKSGDRYKRISLFDAQGRLLLMLPPEDDPTGPIKHSHVTDVLRDPRVQMTDIHRGDAGDIHLNIDFPVFAPAAQTPIAVVLLELDPNHYFYPLVQSWPTPSRTAETLLVRRDGDDVLFLNELRHQKGAALALRGSAKEPRLPAAMGARGEVGTTEGVDYRGVPVVAVVRAL